MTHISRVIHPGWDTEKLLWDLGFHIHLDKSVRIPSQRLEFLGFILDSNAMTVTRTDKRKQKILDMCKVLLQQPCQTIKSIAALVGCFIAAVHYFIVGWSIAKIILFEYITGNIRRSASSQRMLLLTCSGGPLMWRVHQSLFIPRQWH